MMLFLNLWWSLKLCISHKFIELALNDSIPSQRCKAYKICLWVHFSEVCVITSETEMSEILMLCVCLFFQMKTIHPRSWWWGVWFYWHSSQTNLYDPSKEMLLYCIYTMHISIVSGQNMLLMNLDIMVLLMPI
jgi:hypothetical protein